MRTGMWVVAAAAASLALGGCNSQKKGDMTEATPPATGGDAMPTVLSTPAQPVTTPPATGHSSSVAMTPATGGGRTHLVQVKETLWSIAKQEYGDGKKWQDIAKANGNLDPSKLKVGQVLTLP